MARRITSEDYEQLERRIRGWQWPARVAVAAGAAERLLSHHMSACHADQDPFIVGLAPDLEELWQALSSGNTKRDAAIQILFEKHSFDSEATHVIGKSGVPRGDDNAFAAVKYALREYCRRDAKFVSAAQERLITAAVQVADATAEKPGENLMSPEVRSRGALLARHEFDRVIAACRIIECCGITPNSIESVRAVFADGELGAPPAQVVSD